MNSRLKIIAALVFALCLSQALVFGAADFWQNNYRNAKFSLVVKKPSFYHGDYYNGFPPDIVGWTAYLTLKIYRNKSDHLTIEFPYGYGRTNYADGFNFSSRSFGNIYLGYNEFSLKDKLEFAVGLRLPVIGEQSRYAVYTGTFTDITKVGAFIPYALTFSYGFSYLPFGQKGKALSLNLASYLMFNTESPGYYNRIDFYHTLASFLSYGLGFEDSTGISRLKIEYKGLKQINSPHIFNHQSRFSFIEASLDFNLKYFMAGLIVDHAIGKDRDNILQDSFGIRFSYAVD